MYMCEDLKAITPSPRPQATLSLRDFVNGDRNAISEYLALSITRGKRFIYIKVTTTDGQPVTYTATISNRKHIDFDTLQFVKSHSSLL